MSDLNILFGRPTGGTDGDDRSRSRRSPPKSDVDSELAAPEQFAFLGRVIDSPFFTADVARLANGDFTVVEINDGGCSVFPEQLDPRDFYRAVLR